VSQSLQMTPGIANDLVVRACDFTARSEQARVSISGGDRLPGLGHPAFSPDTVVGLWLQLRKLMT
jgi:hypothetical protein